MATVFNASNFSVPSFADVRDFFPENTPRTMLYSAGASFFATALLGNSASIGRYFAAAMLGAVCTIFGVIVTKGFCYATEKGPNETFSFYENAAKRFITVIIPFELFKTMSSFEVNYTTILVISLVQSFFFDTYAVDEANPVIAIL